MVETGDRLEWDKGVRNADMQGVIQCLFYGLGSDGTVSANKNTLKHLQSKSGVTNIVYINYWGGSYTSPAWNESQSNR